VDISRARTIGEQREIGSPQQFGRGRARGGVRDARRENHQRASGQFAEEKMERRVREEKTDEAVPRSDLAGKRRISPNRHEYDRPLHRGQ
jgi:hypothetical protein